ncbi:hypothetical protein G5V58_12665 [Nocardioides anomalus]|uniref:Uncharacterized protein n=1 Tax=Nocardioides anomalus TaxID=2712223 RepID=A0A6G6WEC1_9ACTN|nr:hypothetical protein [Nocardioides anomalus]QIG43503.1 hypothetical protein G5V58_12665 [Nocardioides anomalus]
MVWVLLVATGLLAVLVGALAWRVRGLERTLRSTLERSLAEPAAPAAPAEPVPAPQPQFVITRVGEPEEPVAPAPTVPAPVFADLLLKETVVQTASLLHGVRRALAPETRNRIRFHVRQEVKRSRKQRRADLRDFRREWAARQREGTAA